MHILLLLLSTLAFAESTHLDLFEKTYPRDNTFCDFGKVRVEIGLRGHARSIDPSERGYGELLFLRYDENKIALDMKEAQSGMYHFFPGTTPHCKKHLGFMVGPRTFAILLRKMNRPHVDRLALQLFDTVSLSPKKFILTDYLADVAVPAKDGFYFRSHGERLDIDMGSFLWEEKKFTYQDRLFQEWFHFTEEKFTLDEKETFERSPFKAYFKDLTDFLNSTGWVASSKTFTKKILYVAVNHELGKECLYVTSEKSKLSGSETGWRCKKP